MQKIHFSSMVMLGCQVATAQSRRKKVVPQLDVLKVNLALSIQATTLSTSGCKDAMIMSFLRALLAQQIISIGTDKDILLEFDQEIVYVDCEKDEALGQTFLESSRGA